MHFDKVMFGKLVVLSCTLEGQDSGRRGSSDRFEIWKSCGSFALFLFGPVASYFVTYHYGVGLLQANSFPCGNFSGKEYFVELIQSYS